MATSDRKVLKSCSRTPSPAMLMGEKRDEHVHDGDDRQEGEQVGMEMHRAQDAIAHPGDADVGGQRPDHRKQVDPEGVGGAFIRGKDGTGAMRQRQKSA